MAFAVLTCTGKAEQRFMTIYTVIVSFYFGIPSTPAAGGGEE